VLPRGYQRPEIEVLLARAGNQRSESLCKPARDLFGNALLDEDPAAGRTGLAAVLDDRVDEDGHRGVQVGIGEDQLRRLAAQFERDGTVVSGGRLRDQGAGRGGAGEGDVVDAGVRGQRRAGLGAETGDDVEDALRQPGFRAEFGSPQQRQARVLCRFHDAGVAGRDGRAHRAPEDLHRVVPRHDVAGDAVGLADREHGIAVLVGNGLAVQLVRGARIELEVAGQGGGVAACLSHRLAGVQAFQQGEFFGVIRHDPGPLVEDPAARRRGGRAPGLAVGGSRRRDSTIDVGGRPPGQGSQGEAAGRIHDVDGFAAARGLRAVVDEMPVLSGFSDHGGSPRLMPCLLPVGCRARCCRAPGRFTIMIA
jgi:hypothetical protein